MPTYKNSKTQSKNGGRRRKHTMRKLRRMKKSRKVMRGGADTVSYDLLKTTLERDKAMESFLKTMNKQSWDEFKRVGDGIETVNIREIYKSFFENTDSQVEITLLDLLNRKS